MPISNISLRNTGLHTLAALLFLACAVPALAQEMTAALIDQNNKPVGTARVAPTQNGTMLTLDVKNISEGWHGLHLHEKGVCDPDEKFTTAGGHAHKEGQHHGVHNEAGPHAGDLPNLWVGADGIAKAQFFTPYITMDDLGDADGTALVIHATADDYKTDPAGAAGDRIACGVLTLP